ncbi:hypothetical protein DIPPA_70218 [Diplonema papillatum]|nr:hypothetical protein DIPPA_70218 [Diplonema papillatum]
MGLRFVLLLACAGLFPAGARAQPPFDLDTGDGYLVVVLEFFNIIGRDITPNSADPTLLLHAVTIMNTAMFDATCPYQETAVGVYSRIERRPEAEWTTRNLNTAILYAAYVSFIDILPKRKPDVGAVMTRIGLEVDTDLIDTTDLTTAVGIAWTAATNVTNGRRNDGMNAKGDANRNRNLRTYEDTTDYTPVNNAYDLKNPSRWQPAMQLMRTGKYLIQQFVTPQAGITEPFSYANPNAWQTPEPTKSNARNWRDYRKQAEEVLEASAALTDEQKVTAELFDDKVQSLAFSIFARARGQSAMRFQHADFVMNMATFDAAIFMWNEKRRWDTVRPFSAIRYLYGSRNVKAWGGVGEGNVTMRGQDWESYMPVGDHPEYPSGSTCLCHAHAQAARLYFGGDDLNWERPFAAGSSKIEPGVTPANDVVLSFPTWTDFADQCGKSRMYAGVHFQDAIDAAADICGQFGGFAFSYYDALLNGTAPMRGPAKPLKKPRFYKSGKGSWHHKH